MKDNYFQGLVKNELVSSPEKYLDEYQQKLWPDLINSSVRYHGDPVKFPYTPHLVSARQWKFFREFTEKLTAIFNKITDRYLYDPGFRNLFPFSEKMEKYILIDPGYPGHFPIARYDILYNQQGEIKLGELNTDGTSAMNEVRVMQNILGESALLRWLRDNHGVSLYGFELFRSWIEILLDKYRCFSGKKRVSPVVAIVDFFEDGILSEFKVFARMLNEWGVETFLADPRQLEYAGSKLKYKDKTIDLIYRRSTTGRLFENFNEVRPLFEAYKSRDVCLCGGFRSQVIHNKAVFRVLSQAEEFNFLSDDEKEFLDNYLLETGYGSEIDENNRLQRKLKENKDEYVLKPCDSFAGKGVRLGRHHSLFEWNNLLEECSRRDYLYQEYCPTNTIELLPAYDYEDKGEKKPELEPFNYTFGFYMYDGSLQGLYNRAGRCDIIGTDYECITVPVYVAVPENTSLQGLKEEVKYE